MTAEPATSDDDEFDAPLTLLDWVEIVTDDLDQAVDALSDGEIEQLIGAVRRKIDEMAL